MELTKEILFIKQPTGKGPGAIKVMENGQDMWIDCWPDTLVKFVQGGTYTFTTYQGKEFNGKTPTIVSKKDPITAVGTQQDPRSDTQSASSNSNTVTVADTSKAVARRIFVCGKVNQRISSGATDEQASETLKFWAARADRYIKWSETGDLSLLGAGNQEKEPEPKSDLDMKIPF